MSTVRACGCQLAHRCQDRALNAAIHRDLTQALQRALDGGDPLGSAGVNHQLIAHRPTPTGVSALDRVQQQAACLRIPASLHPGGGIRKHWAGPVPKPGGGHRAVGGAFKRSTAARSRSNPPSSIASNSASAAARLLRPASSSASAPSTARRRSSVASASRVPVAARTRASASPNSGSAVTAIRGCLEGIASTV